MKYARVVSDYRSAYPDPLVLQRGAKLRVSDKTSPWPGWLWGEDTNGKKGWIPTSFVNRRGDTGEMNRDYDATELSVKKGDRLTVLDEEAGWVWVDGPDGRRGWVPKENIEME